MHQTATAWQAEILQRRDTNVPGRGDEAYSLVGLVAAARRGAYSIEVVEMPGLQSKNDNAAHRKCFTFEDSPVDGRCSVRIRDARHNLYATLRQTPEGIETWGEATNGHGGYVPAQVGAARRISLACKRGGTLEFSLKYSACAHAAIGAALDWKAGKRDGTGLTWIESEGIFGMLEREFGHEVTTDQQGSLWPAEAAAADDD
jgi:hypothetical protein